MGEKNYKNKYEEQLDINGCLCDKIEKAENETEKVKNKILKETTNFCKECPSCGCCPEEECIIYRIEKLIIGEKK